jgi:hypothetical protein
MGEKKGHGASLMLGGDAACPSYLQILQDYMYYRNEVRAPFTQRAYITFVQFFYFT